jgi:polyisoprenoid-binding protein YceI
MRHAAQETAARPQLRWSAPARGGLGGRVRATTRCTPTRATAAVSPSGSKRPTELASNCPEQEPPMKRQPTRIRGRRVAVAIACGASSLLVALPVSASAEPTSGSRCNPAQHNKTVTTKTEKFVCTQVGGGYVWRPIAATRASYTSGGSASDVAVAVGTWRTMQGSQAGYRMREIYVGGAAKSDAVGRTSDVSGEFVLDVSSGALQLRSGRVTVDMTTLKSDQARRDDWLRTNSLETSKFKSAVFEVAESTPVNVPSTGQAARVMLRGRLTLHGVTKSVTIPVDARLTGDIFDVVGSIRITLEDYGIPTPVIPGVVSTDDTGMLEFALVLRRA